MKGLIMDSEELLLTRCKRLSPIITEYFDGMRYLGDLDDAEQATPAYLTQLGVAMIMDEVAEIGIVSTFEVEDFITDCANFEAMFAIRERFDGERLYDYLKSMTQEQVSIVRDIVEGTHQDGDILLEIINYFCSISPLDMKLAQILQCSNQWTSVNKFRKHLEAIFRKLDNTDLVKPSVTDDNVDAISKFLQKILRNERKLNRCLDILTVGLKELNEDVLRDAVRNYDHEKLDPDLLPLFATASEDAPEPPFVTKHHITVNHHIEYWEYKKKHNLAFVFTKENVVMILLALLLDGLSDDKIVIEFKRLYKLVPTSILNYGLDILNHYGASLRRVIDETN